MNRFKSFLPLLILIAIGIALLSTGVLNRFRPETLASEQALLQAHIAAHPVRAWLLHVGVTMLAIATGVPGVLVIILAGGMLFGIVGGTILSSIGLTLGALILFFASRRAFAGAAGGTAPALVEKLRAGYLAHPVSYTFFLRLVPFFPFGGVTVALAWLRCPLWLFTAASAGGGALMVGIETALGAGLAKNIGANHAVNLNLFSDPVVIGPVLAMGLLALAPVVIGKWREARARRVD
ncbi:MAG: TVP38/TMEM64 family protein [Proteobacteria bacterium]|nr:TVP38/TMEM64 family protein [Pseudomonadota bacterium]